MEAIKKQKPIGRMWIKETVVTGYIVIGRICIKFACSKDTKNKDKNGEIISLIYPSRKEK